MRDEDKFIGEQDRRTGGQLVTLRDGMSIESHNLNLVRVENYS